MESLRIDRYLWAARFWKTRALAQAAIEAGHVRIGGERIKPARAIRPGTVIALRQGRLRRQIEVIALSESRGPASIAQTLYREIAPQQRVGLFDDDEIVIPGRPVRDDQIS